MNPESEIWQVKTQAEVFQADLATLKQWIGEGLVHPGDMVKKGSFKWIEAGRAPALRAVFAGDEQPAPAAPEPATLTAHTPAAPPSFDGGLATEATPFRPVEPAHDARAAQIHFPQATPGHCHPQHAPQHVCRVCGATFCRDCVRFAQNTRIALCALCGDLCKPYEEIRAARSHYEYQASGFGFDDLRQSLAYPFKYIVSLLFGAALYGLLLLAGFRGQILAAAILFGCLSLVINRVAYGKFDRDFLPDFSSFSPWDDLFVPLRLGVGVVIVTFGPTILLMLALVFGWFGGAERAGTDVTAGASEIQAAREVAARASAHADPEKQLQLSPGANPAQSQPAQGAPLSDKDLDVLINGGNAEQEAEVKRKVQAMTPAGQMSQQIESSSAGADILTRIWSQLVAHPGLIALLLLAALGWAVFYYPMAIAVAGYTEEFSSVVNPLVGLDTIRRMGMTYAKAFVMYLAIEIAGGVAGIIISIITAPFNMPFIGNLPATFIGGMLTFYINLVIACLLGLAIFKSADRLGIDVG